MIYLISFIMSYFLLELSEKVPLKKIVIIVAILIPCIIAGLRNFTIGTDIGGYVKPLYNCAMNAKSIVEYHSMSWTRLWQTRYVSGYEEGFTLIVFLITKIFKNFQILLFFLELLIILPVYYGIKKLKLKYSLTWLPMLAYYFLFYNLGLNVVRQMISLSFLFFGVSCLLVDKNKKKYFIFLIISLFFHTTSLLGIILYVIYNYTISKKDSKLSLNNYNKLSISKVCFSLIIIISIILFLNTNILISVLKLLNLERYSLYIDGDQFYLSKYILLNILPLIFIAVLKYKKNNLNINEKYFYYLIFIISVLTSLYSGTNKFGGRVNYIFQIFNIILFPILCKKENKENFLIKCFFVSYLVLFWYTNFIYFPRGNTYPYKLFF